MLPGQLSEQPNGKFSLNPLPSAAMLPGLADDPPRVRESVSIRFLQRRCSRDHLPSRRPGRASQSASFSGGAPGNLATGTQSLWRSQSASFSGGAPGPRSMAARASRSSLNPLPSAAVLPGDETICRHSLELSQSASFSGGAPGTHDGGSELHYVSIRFLQRRCSRGRSDRCNPWCSVSIRFLQRRCSRDVVPVGCTQTEGLNPLPSAAVLPGGVPSSRTPAAVSQSASFSGGAPGSARSARRRRASLNPLPSAAVLPGISSSVTNSARLNPLPSAAVLPGRRSSIGR